MENKTALTELIDELNIIMENIQENHQGGIRISIETAKEYLAKEKKMVVDAFNQDLYGGLEGRMKYQDGEEYFTQTFPS